MLQRGKPAIVDKQEVLLDARNLATTAADFFGAKISKTSDGSLEFEEWQDTLSDSEKKYKGKQTTYARTQPLAVSLNMIDRLRLLSIDSYYTSRFLLTEFNNLGTTNLDVVNTQVGVISPLSGDYLLASVCRSILERTRGETFSLKLAATDSKLEVVLFEQGQLGQNFENLPNIGIFLDAIQTSNTGSAIYNGAKKEFPGKNVYRPKTITAELKPNARIRKAMRQAGIK